MAKVLITGFEPFGNASSNPSAEIVKQMTTSGLCSVIKANNRSADCAYATGKIAVTMLSPVICSTDRASDYGSEG